MLEKDVKKQEYKYFGCHNDMVVPELLCYYFEEGLYELVYYLAELHRDEFWECMFYLMMSKVMLGHKEDAERIYRGNEGEWYNSCKTYGIYWKHVALYGVIFCDYQISAYYQEVFDEYYDQECVEMLLLRMENPKLDWGRIDRYKKVLEKYPVLKQTQEESDSADKREIATFESMQWRIWSKYNQNIGRGKEYGIEKVYGKNGIEIYSYKSKEVSASMHIIVDEEHAVILDCGCEIHDTEVIRIPVNEILKYLGLKKIDGVLVSHAHMDHYGSLNEVRGLDLYMTKETRQLIQYVSPEVYLGNVTVVEAGQEFSVGGIEVTFVPNGHILGSVMMDINWKDAVRIVYTGDYSVEDQETVKGFRVEDILKNPKRVDVLITESTYGGQQEMLTLKEYEKIFKILCEKFVQNGTKIMIPGFAIGRCQEAALLLADVARENGFKILIDGMAAAITGYYQMILRKNILSKNIAVGNSELKYEEKIFNNDIILSSSGMLKEGSTSANYMKKMMEESKICVMKVGFIREEEHMLKSIRSRQSRNLRLLEIPLTAHAGYRSLVEVTERISPDCAIYVHGQGIMR